MAKKSIKIKPIKLSIDNIFFKENPQEIVPETLFHNGKTQKSKTKRKK